jgi:diketogulonate reductase-like aldo/keto reductase
MLSELRLEYLDLLLLHHAKGNSAKERAEQWQALLDVAAAGKARNIGVSNYDLNQLKLLKVHLRSSRGRSRRAHIQSRRHTSNATNCGEPY